MKIPLFSLFAEAFATNVWYSIYYKSIVTLETWFWSSTVPIMKRNSTVANWIPS